MAKQKYNDFKLIQNLKMSVFNILKQKKTKLYIWANEECGLLVVGPTKTAIKQAVKKAQGKSCQNTSAVISKITGIVVAHTATKKTKKKVTA